MVVLTIICSMYIIGSVLHFINQDANILTLLHFQTKISKQVNGKMKTID